MWIHGRTRGSVNTLVQMEHSVISYSTFTTDNCFAAMLLPTRILTGRLVGLGLTVANDVGKSVKNESESQVRSALGEGFSI